MATDDNPRFPHPGKVTVAILENLVQPVIGADAIKELKAPVLAKEQREALVKALTNAEKRFISEHSDTEVSVDPNFGKAL